jgi:competence protein ComFC
MHVLKKILDILFPASETEKRFVALCRQGAIPNAVPVPHTNIFAITHYRDPVVQASIRILKTKHNVPIAHCFAKLIHEHITALLQDKEPFTTYEKIIIVPIPITTDRLHERGFNQTELIANELAKLDKRYCVKKLLTKIRETKKQAVSISKTKRRENIKGCFTCKKNEHNTKSTLYVVLDDVVTIGATMNEAIVTLGKSKYKPVIGIAAAH